MTEPTAKSMPARALDWTLNMWFAPISPARLRIFEKAFTLTFIYYVANWGLYAREWLTTDGFHFSTDLTNYAYPDPVPPLPPEWLIPFMIVLIGAPTLIVLGVFRRPALFVTFCCAVYIQLVEIAAAFTLNKLFIVFFLLLLLVPDPEKIKVEGHDEPQWRQSAWPVRIIQSTLLIQYCTAGICKMNGDWLKEADILYGHTAGLYRNWLATLAVLHLPHWTWIAQSVFALCFEFFAPVFFLVRKLRPLAFLMGIGMHIVIAALMKDLIFFSAQMITFYILFLKDSQVEPLDNWIEGKRQAAIDKIFKKSPQTP